MSEWVLLAAAALAVALIVFLVLAWRRLAALDPAQLREGQERAERSVRDDLARNRREAAETGVALRHEVGASMKNAADTLVRSVGEISSVQKAQLEAFAARIAELSETSTRSLAEVRSAVEAKLAEVQADNAAKLEEMRKTVDEKLQSTLDTRLGESFKLVSERLEQVHRGLGEMQALASGVRDLERVLTNVKARGTWGEWQLASLLEQVLTPEQYDTNVATRRGSQDRVEFAVRLPGQGGPGGPPVYLPIDSKFPREDYERLLDAVDRADPDALELAGKQLEARVKAEARDIQDKYLDPPGTTDFAILFLPVEGLYAEVLRRPGLVETLQRECRVNVAGPTTLAALLNSLQMGFRTLAIQERSSEVWRVLGAVKTEFAKLGDSIDKVHRKLQEATHVVEHVTTRRRAMQRKLREVEALPTAEARALLGAGPDPDVDAGDERDDEPAPP
jgi:DNA recombination protein RmuC